MTSDDKTSFLKSLFTVAVAAAHPESCLADQLPSPRNGKALVIGAGKAAASMAATFESAWQGPVRGIVVTRYAHSEPCNSITVVEASHPVPDGAGARAAEDIMALLKDRKEDEEVFFLLSGGGSALLSLPAPGITLDQKKAINKALLRCGAAIDEINCVRKHLSAIKGGRLAQMCPDTTIHTYAISDVPGDDPCVIASGPTVPDPTTSAEALQILRKYQIDTPENVHDWLNDPASETPKLSDMPTAANHYHMISTPLKALMAAKAAAESQGYAVWLLGDTIEGEAREVAKVHYGIAEFIQRTRPFGDQPCVLLSGGETTVTIKGTGRGGRNAEFLLSFACECRGRPGIYALAADTDGIDGTEDNAGAVMTPNTAKMAEESGFDMEHMLDNNDGYSFFKGVNQLIITSPTRTNVNDFRAILIE